MNGERKPIRKRVRNIVFLVSVISLTLATAVGVYNMFSIRDSSSEALRSQLEINLTNTIADKAALADARFGRFAEYIIETDDAEAAKAVLGGGDGLIAQGEMLYLNLNSATAKEDIAQTIKLLTQKNINIYSVHPKDSKKLEDVFIELTGKTEGGGQIE